MCEFTQPHRSLFINICLYVCVGLFVNGDVNELNTASNKSSKLVEKIRRQLIEDNYDYQPSESEEIVPVKRQHDEQESWDVREYYDDENEVNEEYSINENEQQNDNTIVVFQEPKYKSDSLFVPRARDDEFKEEKEVKRDDDHGISKKDLLYYMDDERLSKIKLVKGDVETNATKSTSKMKYKLLKFPSHGGNRRNMGYRRFIQEEGEEGVAILNLDDAPIPEFRLPKNRRQYMEFRESEDNGLDTTDEIAPPPVNISNEIGEER